MRGCVDKVPRPVPGFRLASIEWNWGISAIKRGVGGGVFELRINFGPGYRAYCGRAGDELVILCGGGTKKGQTRDIANARIRWKAYKQEK